MEKLEQLYADKTKLKRLRELQATLTKIDQKIPCFFNITVFKDLGLVKEHGKNLKNATNWILSDKGKDLLKIQL
jgi:hypothetical protein